MKKILAKEKDNLIKFEKFLVEENIKFRKEIDTLKLMFEKFII